MLRALVVLLLLANGLFAVWSVGGFGSALPPPGASQREPERLTQQLRPERVQVLPPGVAAPASAAASAATAGSAADAAASAASAAAAAASAPASEVAASAPAAAGSAAPARAASRPAARR